MVLGIYYLTKAKPGAKGEGRAFANIDEVLLAKEMGEVETLTPIRLRYSGEVIDFTTAYDDQDVAHTEPTMFERQYISTTVGRAIMNDHIKRGAADMPYINGLLKKKGSRQAGELLLPALWSGDHGADARRHQAAGLPLRHQGWLVDRYRRHGHPAEQGGHW